MAFAIADIWNSLINWFGNYATLPDISWCVPSLELMDLPSEPKDLQVQQSERT